MTKLSDYFDYKTDAQGLTYVEASIRGMSLLRLPATNKGTAFTLQERIELGLDGLLPPLITDIEEQIERLYVSYRKQQNDISKYQFLRAIQDRSEVLFYALLERHLEEMTPIIYTPTIGQAVQQFSSLYRTARGLTLSAHNIDRIEDILRQYPLRDVRIIVVTDASAILGIGDQGMGGLSICIGKLALYTVGGGLCPFQTLPVNLDVGTNREELLDDPHYLGIREKRLHDAAYFDLVDKFVQAVKNTWPKAIIQWEDFTKDVAFDVLHRYRRQLPCFNDDIQGTGAMALAGLLSACRLKGETLPEQVVVVVGAGAGGIGVASAIRAGMIHAGLSPEQAGHQIFVVDVYGLVVEDSRLEPYKQPLAQAESVYRDWDTAKGGIPELADVIRHARPGVLIGLSGAAGIFDQCIIAAMAENHARPVIFPLSNPTAHCEATPADILHWTQGQAIVATGSPFADVECQGARHVIGQGNNAFIFPGLGLAAMLGECRIISDGMILEAAYALAEYIAEHCLAAGMIYPPIADLKKISACVAARVLAQALADGSSPRTELLDTDLQAYVEAGMWQARYLPFRFAED
ncbi:MAG: NAD-dependent malic enzyme [Methylococcales bacterium]|nr:NAD-dependent malic enzyme [Methylococcales bacterium]